MKFMDHVNELRKRIQLALIGFLLSWTIAFMIYPYVVSFLMSPFESIVSDSGMVVHTIYEGFLAKFKLSAITGLVLATPWFIFQIIRFIFPGLKKKERFWVAVTLLISLLLAVAAVLLSYTKIIPLSVYFLTNSGFIPTDVGIMLNFQQNVHYIVQLIFYFVILFQTPIILELCLALNILRRQQLIKHFRLVCVGIFIVSAIITPPDIVSQCGLAVPLIGLYGVTILFAKIMNWGNP